MATVLIRGKLRESEVDDTPLNDTITPTTKDMRKKSALGSNSISTGATEQRESVGITNVSS